MATGDDAVAAGMSLVDGAAAGSAAAIDDHINLTRDYVAQGPARWKPGVILAVADGGTGATTAAGARTSLGITALIPTEASDIGAVENDGAGNLSIGAIGGNRVRVVNPGYVTSSTLAYLSDVTDAVAKTGDEMSGYLRVLDHIYVPNSFAAVSGYTIAYINSDGRISKGASSERYKKFISAIEPSELGDIFPQLHRFQMRSLDGTGDGVWHYGYIAERLAENNEQRIFVVYDQEGRPDSIDFIGLLLAQVAQLHDRDQERSEQIADLLGRVASLEGVS